MPGPADSFAAREIGARTRIARTKAIFTQVLLAKLDGRAASRSANACGGLVLNLPCIPSSCALSPYAVFTSPSLKPWTQSLPSLQDVILRGGKALPLYARVVEAGVPRAIVLPAVPGGQLKVKPGGGGLLLNQITLVGNPLGGQLVLIWSLVAADTSSAWLHLWMHTAPLPPQVELRPQDQSWECFLDAVPQPPVLRAHVAGGEEVTGVIFSSGTTGGVG